MGVNWQRIEPWLKPYGKGKKNRAISDSKFAEYERKLGIKFPDDFKEFHRQFRKQAYWRIDRWILLSFEDVIGETQDMSQFIMITDEIYGDNYDEQYWNPKWLVFACEIEGENAIALNLDPDTNLDSVECIFSQLDEVFELKWFEEEAHIYPMRCGFGRWLEKWGIKLEKLNQVP